MNEQLEVVDEDLSSLESAEDLEEVDEESEMEVDDGAAEDIEQDSEGDNDEDDEDALELESDAGSEGFDGYEEQPEAEEEDDEDLNSDDNAMDALGQLDSDQDDVDSADIDEPKAAIRSGLGISGDAATEQSRTSNLVKSPERRSDRVESRASKSVYDEQDYELNSAKQNTPQASNAIDFAPVSKYFMSRLSERVIACGGSADALKDWRLEINRRNGILLGGIIDVFYLSPAHKRFRCRVDVIVALGLGSYSKTIKHMSREELADMANENREKQLIAYQFDRHGNKCLEIKRDGDNLIVIPVPETTEKAIENMEMTRISNLVGTPGEASTMNESGRANKPSPESLVFGYGNISVLNWGKVSSNPLFSTKTQIYPIGFKCLRQEYDIILDRTVDCVCEIMSQNISSISTDATLCNGNGSLGTTTILAPLFRISISWLLGKRFEKKVVRVYEGKSPQLAWQAAMLETLGTENEFKLPLEENDSNAFIEGVAMVENPPTPIEDSTPSAFCEAVKDEPMTSIFEPMDQEEIMLRKQLMEKRKEHMKLLHRAQTLKVQNPMRPRLEMQCLDTFFDEGILRAIEGMDNVIDCANYEFTEVRSQESGFRGLMHALSLTQGVTKKIQHTVENMCERFDLITRFPTVTDEELDRGGSWSNATRSSGGHQVDGRRPLFAHATGKQLSRTLHPMNSMYLNEDFEARRQKKADDRRIEEVIRQKKIAAKNQLLAARKAKARDVEKMMRAVRESTLKSTLAKRTEARSLVEFACDEEESELQLQCSPFYAMQPLWKTVFAACDDVIKKAEKPGDEVNVSHQYRTPARPRAVVPLLDSREMNIFNVLGGDYLGSLLEIWGFMHSFAIPLCISKIPSPERLLNAIMSCDDLHVRNVNSLNKSIDDLRNLIADKAANVAPSSGLRYKDGYVVLTDAKELLCNLETVAPPLIPQLDAERMLTEIAISFCTMLMPDFNYWMGVDEAVGILGDVRPTINPLTWMEIARVVLQVSLMQEIKVPDINIACSLRGRGHTTAPDNYDKRTLRLSRRRIIANGGGTDTLPHVNMASRSLEKKIELVESDYNGFEMNGLDYISREKYQAITRNFATLKNSTSHLVDYLRSTVGYNGVGGLGLGICVRVPAPGGYRQKKSNKREIEGPLSNLVYSKTRNENIDVGSGGSWLRFLNLLNNIDERNRSAVRRIVILTIEGALSHAKVMSISETESNQCIASARLLTNLLKNEPDTGELKRRAILLLNSCTDAPLSGIESAELLTPVSILEAWEYQQRARRDPIAVPLYPLDAEEAALIPQFIEALEAAQKQPDSNVNNVLDILRRSKTGLQDSPVLLSVLSGLSLKCAILRLQFLFSLHKKSIIEKPAEMNVEVSDNEIDNEEEGNKPEPKGPSSGSKSKFTDKAVEEAERAKDTKGRFVVKQETPCKARAVSNPGDMEISHDENALPPNFIEYWERDHLTTMPCVVQRCFHVLAELMIHPMSVEFNHAVDSNKVPEFYASIRRPLCFSDIRQCLLEGGYNTDTILVSFYRDVTLVLDNSLAFNPETDLLVQAALKVSMVFERLYFEVLLSVEECDWMPEACAACRRILCPHDVEDLTEAVLCDRCDAPYHLACINPLLEFLPRGDWYCPACMHGKKIRDVHPCIGLLVHRPSSSPGHPNGFSDIGRVVDFRHMGVSDACLAGKKCGKRYTMQYVVMFPKLVDGQQFISAKELDAMDFTKSSPASAGAHYELWSGSNVRKYSCRYKSEASDVKDPVPVLPEGYNYDDYDEACTFARGYTGWSSLSSGLPAALSSNCYLPTLALLREDKEMAKYQRALVALSPLSCSSNLCSPFVFGMEEWLCVLNALVHRIINSQKGRDFAASYDEEATRSRTFNENNMSLVSIVSSLKQLFSYGPKIGNELKISDDLEKEEDLEDALETSTEDEEVEHIQKPILATQVSVASTVANRDNRGSGKSTAIKHTKLSDTESDSGIELSVDGDVDIDGAIAEITTIPKSFVTKRIAKTDPRVDWKNKRMSRRRGREDAFFTTQLMHEMLHKVDSELAADIEAEKALLHKYSPDENLSMSTYCGRSIVFQTASRLFVNRPPDSVSHPGEWLKAWDACQQFDLDGYHALKTPPIETSGQDAMKLVSQNERKSTRCQLCGYDEHTIGSVFVWGESREQWELATYGISSRSWDSFVDIFKELSVIGNCIVKEFGGVKELVELWGDHHGNAQRRKKQFSSFLAALNSAESLYSTMNTSFREAKKCEIVWTPVNSNLAELEYSEVAKLSDAMDRRLDSKTDPEIPVLRKGDVLVHECCAENMNNFRKASTARLAKKNIMLLAEMVTGMKRGKIFPIGCDNNGNIYWVLPGQRDCVFVCVPKKNCIPQEHYGKLASQVGLDLFPSQFPPDYSAINRCFNREAASWLNELDSVADAYQLSLLKSIEGPYGKPSTDDTCSWRVLKGVTDITRLARWLCPEDYFCEKQLNVVLQLLYPEVLVVMQNCCALEDEGVVTAKEKEMSLFCDIWKRLESGFKSADERAAFFQSSFPSAVDASEFVEEQDDESDIEEEIDDEVEEPVAAADDVADSGAEELDEKSEEEDEEGLSDEDAATGSKKRKRQIFEGKKIKSLATDEDSGEAEADFSEEESNKRVNDPKRARILKGGNDDTGSDDDDNYASKRTLSARRVTSSNSISVAEKREPSIIANAGQKIRKPRGYITPGTKVTVYNAKNELFWEGVVLKCCDFFNRSRNVKRSGVKGVYCLVSFAEWGSEYDRWVSVEEIHKQAQMRSALSWKRFQDDCCVGSIHPTRSSLPEMLLSLNCCQFLLSGGKGRWCEQNSVAGSMLGLSRTLSSIIPDMCGTGVGGDFGFSWGDFTIHGCSSHKDIRLLKAAMLILEASLPEKCVDNADERWGDVDEGFSDFWRSAVIGATDAATLMECQILLEFSVRTAWLSSSGAKLLTCMPSRTHATRFATYGLVALRVWALDEAIRFELATPKPSDQNGHGSDSGAADDESWLESARPSYHGGSSTRPNLNISRDQYNFGKSSTSSKSKSKKKGNRRR